MSSKEKYAGYGQDMTKCCTYLVKQYADSIPLQNTCCIIAGAQVSTHQWQILGY